MNDNASLSTKLPDEASVIAYLNAHPEFLGHHPELLLRMSIPHPQAGASSLLERQIRLARDKHRDLQGQVIELLQAAAGNEQLFRQCQHLVLRVLDQTRIAPERLAGLLDTVETELRRGFGLDAAVILLAPERFPALPERARLDADARDRQLGPELLAGVWCGTPTLAERAFLFGAAGAALQSAASLPLGANGRLGLLALASSDPERFRAGMGTLFLDFVGALLTAVLSPGQPDPA